MSTVALTAREKAILIAMPSFQYTQDNTFEVNSGAWGWSFIDDAAGVLGCSLRSAKGNMTSLINKGILASVPEEDGEKWIIITELGFAVFNELVDEKVAEGVAKAVAAAKGEEAPATKDSTRKLSARQRVMKSPTPGMGWIVLGSVENYSTKRAALRAAADLNRA